VQTLRNSAASPVLELSREESPSISSATPHTTLCIPRTRAGPVHPKVAAH